MGAAEVAVGKVRSLGLRPRLAEQRYRFRRLSRHRAAFRLVQLSGASLNTDQARLTTGRAMSRRIAAAKPYSACKSP